MPGGDGTGPMGQGAMTGRGLGSCNPNSGVNPNVGVNPNNAAFYGRGMGMGRRGMRNFGRGRFFNNNVNAANPVKQNEQDK